MSFPRISSQDFTTAMANHAATVGPLHQTASIDLHGLSVEKARAAVIAQIKLAPEKRWDKIRFITGRGNHVNSRGESGTLYKSFQDWLSEVNNASTKVEKFDGYYEISFVNENDIYNPLEAFFNQEIQNYLSTEIDSIKEAAAKKDYDAMMALALCYDKGIGVTQDYVAATALYKEIADTRKDSLSQFEVGCRYFIGIGIRQNDNEAIRYFDLSAAQGYVLAEFILGTIFHKGTEKIPVDLTRAHKYFLAAAKHKHAEAARKAGSFFYQGLGCTKDDEAAVTLWQQGAELGDKTAAFNLVHMYETGEGVKPDSQLADYYLRLAAKLKEPDGQFLLGLKLFFGLRGATVDVKTGLYWIKQAAQQKHPDALMFLFQIELAAGNTTVAGSYVIGAAQAGEITAQYHITCMPLEKLQRTYTANSKEEKSVVTSNFTAELQAEIKQAFLKQDNSIILSTETINAKAVVGYLMADEHGVVEVKKGIALLKDMAKANSTWAIGCLAGTYLEGHNDIIKINPQLAYPYLLQGEKLNDPKCLVLLGRYWCHGLGIHLPKQQRVNMKKSLEYLDRARAQNYIEAYNELGNFYHTNKNLPLAIENYLKAIELSIARVKDNKSEQIDVLAHASGNVGRIYYKGSETVPRDEKKALYYLDMAAVNGLVEAAMFLFNFYHEADNIEKLIYYANMADKLGDSTAQKFMQGLRSEPKYIPIVDMYCQLQPEQITFDSTYSLQHRPKITDTVSLTKLKARSALPFFAVKSGANTIDAVLECKTPEDYKAVQQLQSDLHCQGKFFKNAKKKKFFVIENVDTIINRP